MPSSDLSRRLSRLAVLFLLSIPFAAGFAIAQRIDELPLAPGSRPAGLAVGSDGNIWFTEEGGNRIGRVSPAGTNIGQPTEYPLPNADSLPHGVTAAADGVLFTEGAGRIGHITATGVVTEFATPGAAPKEIAPGPFAQLWWSDPVHDLVRSVDDLGRQFYAASIAAGSRPEGVAVGAEDLWVAENGSGRILRVYRQPPPSGVPSVGTLQQQEFALPGAASGPWGIAVGPDGSVWFTEPEGGRIGRLDPATGAVTEFALPAGAQPRGIVVGPDHKIWFADAGRGRIVRITPSGPGVGSMAEFPLPAAGSQPTYLVAAPDGNIWFSEAGADRIGRLTIPPFCSEQPTVLCLNGGRFQTTISWSFSTGPYEGMGQALPLTSDAGAFWFFTPNNIELVVKVVDGRAVNGKFWVFGAALTDGQWLLEIRDTETGDIRRYQSAEGQMRSFSDTDAF